MATTSFTLRKLSAGYGSFLQGTGEDTALRSDAYVSLANVGDANANLFTANIIDTDKLTLSWDFSFTFKTSLPAGESAAPISMAIVASTTGEPLTIKDGAQIYKDSRNDVLSIYDTVRVSPGRWVYYSLFIQYSDFAGTTWYERVAKLYIQIPIAYNSIDNLWARIPEYYRILDANQEGNPLYNFLELFGWELDKTRTLIETIPLSIDPELAVTPALHELATQLGLETSIDIVGTTRVRNLLNNIGYIRRRKGTIESISYYLSALTGCAISYETTGTGAGASYTFKVHSQRINFAADPTFNQAVVATTTGTGAIFKTSLTRSATWGVYSYGTTSTTGASVTTNGSTLTVKNVGTETIDVLVYQRTAFPYYPAGDLYTNFTSTQTAGASFNNFHLATTDKMSSWESNVSGGSVPSNILYDTWNTTEQKLPVDTFNPLEERYEIPYNSTSETTVNLVPVLYFTLAANAIVTLTNWLVEPFSVGSYFDGNTREGGLLPAASGLGTGISDYRWHGSAKNSFSYYMLDYQKINTVTRDIIINYIAPVTIKDQIDIVWNYYYGK